MFIAVFFASLGSLSGIAASPISKKSWFPYMILCLIALAVATLIGDAILHLLPHVSVVCVFYIAIKIFQILNFYIFLQILNSKGRFYKRRSVFLCIWHCILNANSIKTHSPRATFLVFLARKAWQYMLLVISSMERIFCLRFLYHRP